MTVLQIATITPYDDEDNVANMLRHLSKNINSGINTLSSSGGSAFFYAVDKCLVKSANALLDAGANPLLHGEPDKNPRDKIDYFIDLAIEESLKEFQDGEVANFTIKNNHVVINKLNALKRRMLGVDKSASEIKKNAMVMVLGARDTCSFFNRLPSEVLTRIAAFTATNGAHTDDEAQDIAAKYFMK